VLGIVGWWAIYYHYRDAFVVNPEVLRVEESEVRQRGRVLLERIEDGFDSSGVRLRVQEPEEWQLIDNGGTPGIRLSYRVLGGEASGELMIVQAPGGDEVTLVRPMDAREGTEVLAISFPFEAFQRIITRGYDSKVMSPLGALYFSITTITTLGLGDVVPRSDLARLLVVTQVFWGVIVFALLCNSLVVMYGMEEKQTESLPPGHPHHPRDTKGNSGPDHGAPPQAATFSPPGNGS
jgi:hypothetical protein